MPLFPEREPKTKPIKEIPEEISPLTIERKEVVQPRSTQFTQQVVSDDGQNLISTPQTQTITIQLPADQPQLKQAAKGSINDSLTWFASFWLRIFKKAIHFGWKVTRKKLPAR